MDSSILDRQHLAILREVDRSGSLTAAAERLNLTQSALSHAMRKFEERHGVAVWQKQGRQLHLTEAGRYLLALAERLLPQLEQAERALRDFAAGGRGTLRVGMECYPCQKWLTRIAADYLKAWPGADLDVSTAFRFDGIGALLGHEIDLLITPDPVQRPETTFVPVFDYELVLAVPDTHRLAEAGVASPADFTDEDLITFPVTLDRLDVFTRFLIPAQRRPRRIRTAETTELMLQLVANGRGVCVVPDWILRQDSADLPLRALRLGPGAGLEKSIHVGFRHGDRDRVHVQGFLALARSAAP